MQIRTLSVAILFVLAACGGSASSGAPTVVNTPAQNSNVGQLVPTSFQVGLPGQTGSSLKRTPKYIGGGAVSAQVALISVNGGAPPSGLTTVVNSAITPAACPCSVAGPYVPPGSDTFTFTSYDAANASGNAIATFTNTFTIAAGSANTGNVVTLLGIPKTLALSGVPNATAGTAIAPASLILAVKDADGNIITGQYANTVTVADSDTSGTQGSGLKLNSGASGTSVVSTQSSDTVKLTYAGLAIPSVTLTASASGVTNATATFAPTLAAIAYSGPLNSSSLPELDLYAPNGTGSTGTFTASEMGWTNTPYNRSLTAIASGCGTIGTVSPASGTSFTFTVAAVTVPGTCSINLSDGNGVTKSIIGTYSGAGFGLQ